MNSAQELLQAIRGLSRPEQEAILSTAPHNVIYPARAGQPKEMQNLLAPYEHRAFVRETAEENPAKGWVTALMSLGYTPMKMAARAGIPIAQAIAGQSRSDPSIDQVIQAFKGAGEGTWSAFQRLMK